MSFKIQLIEQGSSGRAVYSLPEPSFVYNNQLFYAIKQIFISQMHQIHGVSLHSHHSKMGLLFKYNLEKLNKDV